MSGAEAALRGLLPRQVGAAVLDPRADHGPPLPGETAALARMVPARRREFAAGRAAARRAMAGIGLPGRAVPAGDDRAPRWPAGVTGSIAHCATCCVALAGRTRTWRALGVDVEPDAPLPDDLIDSVCTPEERAWLAARPAPARGRLARAIFSAKECTYKAQYPLTGRLLGFEALRITPEPAAGGFTAVFTAPAGEFAAGAALSGGLALRDGLILTVLALPR